MSSRSYTYGSPNATGPYGQGERLPLIQNQQVPPNHEPHPAPSGVSAGAAVGVPNAAVRDTTSTTVTASRTEPYRPLVNPLSLTIPPWYGPRPMYLGSLDDRIMAHRVEVSDGVGSSGYHADDDDDDDDDDDSGWGTAVTYREEDRAAWSSEEWIAYFAEDNYAPVRVSPSLASFDIARAVAFVVLVLALVILLAMYTVLVLVMIFSHEELSG